MVDLINQPHFFIEAAVGLGINGAISLVIGRVVLMETDVAIGFFRLFL